MDAGFPYSPSEAIHTAVEILTFQKRAEAVWSEKERWAFIDWRDQPASRRCSSGSRGRAQGRASRAVQG